MALGVSSATLADILDTTLSTSGWHFLSLTSSISDSSLVSVKEVQGVLTGPNSRAVKLVPGSGVRHLGVECLSPVQLLMVTH